jgi:hypothetical protein
MNLFQDHLNKNKTEININKQSTLKVVTAAAYRPAGAHKLICD